MAFTAVPVSANSMLTSVQGIRALSNGRDFLKGNIKPIPTPVPTIVLETPKMGLNKDALRAKMENLPDEVVRTPDSQTFLRVESGDGKVRWVKVDAAETGSKYLYHYTSEAAAQSIAKTGLKTGKDGFLYLTNKSALSPLQAQIELSLIHI